MNLAECMQALHAVPRKVDTSVYSVSQKLLQNKTNKSCYNRINSMHACIRVYGHCKRLHFVTCSQWQRLCDCHRWQTEFATFILFYKCNGPCAFNSLTDCICTKRDRYQLFLSYSIQVQCNIIDIIIYIFSQSIERFIQWSTICIYRFIHNLSLSPSLFYIYLSISLFIYIQVHTHIQYSMIYTYLYA